MNQCNYPANRSAAFDASFFQGRREAFMKDAKEGDVVILTGAKEHARNSDIMFPFRQESSFYYLTGFEEPDSVAILSKRNFTLLVRPKNKQEEIWTGRRAGAQGAKRKYGADEAYPIDQLETTLDKISKTAKRIKLIPAETNLELSKRIEGHFKAVEDATPELNKLRMVKTPEEIALITRANEISSEAHIKAMKECRRTNGPINECQIKGLMERVFTERGAPRVAYPSIVASGVNATILHYMEDNQDAYPGDLVLIDAAAEYGCYSADITRTWPISGKFTEEQKEIYQIVLDAQNQVIEAVQPGVTITELHEISVQVIFDGLSKLGLIKDKESVKQFYPHTIGHYLGLDTHDVSPFSWSGGAKEIPLEPGMVITVEPGIYIQEDDETVDPKWRGIGVRIEDNILVTPTGSKNLTQVPRTIEEIEAF